MAFFFAAAAAVASGEIAQAHCVELCNCAHHCNSFDKLTEIISVRFKLTQLFGSQTNVITQIK